QPSRVEAYFPETQNVASGGALVVRSRTDPAALASAVHDALRSLDPDVPLFEVRPLEEIVAENSASRRLSVMLIGSVSGLALLLAAVGIYGVMSYSVNQRTHEIGIRMALGADEKHVLEMVLGQGIRLAVAGIVVGLLGAAALARLMTTLLFQVRSLDA